MRGYERLLEQTGPPRSQMKHLWRRATEHRDSFGELPDNMPTTLIFDKQGALSKQLRGRLPAELWDDIAIASCKRGDINRGRSLLADYKCAVDMTVHETSCYVGDLGFGERVPNAALTPLCFRAMCGEMWAPNSHRMGGASSDDPEGIAESLNELKRADRLLKQCNAPEFAPKFKR